MPPKEEHSLSDQVYLDIVTYILKFNKVPAGDQELKPDLEILKQITVAAPPAEADRSPREWRSRGVALRARAERAGQTNLPNRA